MRKQIKYYSTIDAAEEGLLFYAVHPDGRCQVAHTGSVPYWVITDKPADDAIRCSYKQIRKAGFKLPTWE